MEWQFQWGNQTEFLQGIVDSTGELPHGLATKPDLDMFQQMYYTAFQMLSNSRPVAEGRVCYIPYPAMSLYLDDTAVYAVDERMSWIRILQYLDYVWVTHFNKKISDQREQDKRNSAAKNRVAGRRGRR